MFAAWSRRGPFKVFEDEIVIILSPCATSSKRQRSLLEVLMSRACQSKPQTI